MTVADSTWSDKTRKRPLVIAHRGACQAAPENSLLAFALAHQQGADGIELDVFCCATGETIVFHDADLSRWGGTAEDIVSEMPWQTLSQVSLGHGQSIPTLDDVFKQFGHRFLINVELKTAPTWRKRLVDRNLPHKVAELIARHAVQGNVLVSSFDPLLLGRFQKLAPQIATGLLFAHDQSRPLRHAWPGRWLHPYALHPESELINAPQLARWRERGYRLHAWTVNSAYEIERLTALGVDALITDDVELTRKVLASKLS